MMIYLIILAVGVAGIYAWRSGFKPRFPTGWSLPQNMPWEKWAALLGAFAGLDLALYKSGWVPHLFEGAGLWHIPTYLGYVIVGYLIDTHLGGRVRKGALAMWWIGLFILGTSHITPQSWKSCPPGDEVCLQKREVALQAKREHEQKLAAIQAKALVEAEAAVAKARRTSKKCDGEINVVELKYGDEPTVINDSASCLMRWGVDPGGRVRFIDRRGNKMTVGSEPGQHYDNLWPRAVQAVGGNATFRYQLLTSFD